MRKNMITGLALCALLPAVAAWDDGCCIGPTCPPGDEGSDTDGDPGVPHLLPGQHPCDAIAAERFSSYQWTFRPLKGSDYLAPQPPTGGSILYTLIGDTAGWDVPDVLGPAPGPSMWLYGATDVAVSVPTVEWDWNDRADVHVTWAVSDGRPGLMFARIRHGFSMLDPDVYVEDEMVPFALLPGGSGYATVMVADTGPRLALSGTEYDMHLHTNAYDHTTMLAGQIGLGWPYVDAVPSEIPGAGYQPVAARGAGFVPYGGTCKIWQVDEFPGAGADESGGNGTSGGRSDSSG